MSVETRRHEAAYPNKTMSITNQAGREFRTPNPSRASRNIPMKRPSSCRAFIVAQPPAQDHPRVFHAESRLEEKVIYLSLADTKVHDLWDQPSAVAFTDEDGKRRHHTFDFLMTFKCGHRRAIAVKPSSKVYQKDFIGELRHVAKDLPQDFADSVALITERSFSRADALNAERFHFLKQHADPEADETLRDVAPSLPEPLTIAELGQKTGLNGRIFSAAFRALYSGILKQAKAGIIDLPTHVMAGEVLS